MAALHGIKEMPYGSADQDKGLHNVAQKRIRHRYSLHDEGGGITPHSHGMRSRTAE